MARRVRKATQAGEISINMTPMIDCTFQLIIFFILTTQMTSAELARLELHKPHYSQAQDPEDMKLNAPNKVIVNVPSRWVGTEKQKIPPGQIGQAKVYKVKGAIIPIDQADIGNAIPELTKILKQLRAAAEAAGYKEFFLEIRADKSVEFDYIKPVMMAAGDAGIQKMRLTAQPRKRGETQ